MATASGTRQPREKLSERRCAYCFVPLKVVAGRHVEICQRCGRQQPGANHNQRMGHGRG